MVPTFGLYLFFKKISAFKNQDKTVQTLKNQDKTVQTLKNQNYIDMVTLFVIFFKQRKLKG